MTDVVINQSPKLNRQQSQAAAKMVHEARERAVSAADRRRSATMLKLVIEVWNERCLAAKAERAAAARGAEEQRLRERAEKLRAEEERARAEVDAKAKAAAESLMKQRQAMEAARLAAAARLSSDPAREEELRRKARETLEATVAAYNANKSHSPRSTSSAGRPGGASLSAKAAKARAAEQIEKAAAAAEMLRQSYGYDRSTDGEDVLLAQKKAHARAVSSPSYPRRKSVGSRAAWRPGGMRAPPQEEEPFVPPARRTRSPLRDQRSVASPSPFSPYSSTYSSPFRSRSSPGRHLSPEHREEVVREIRRLVRPPWNAGPPDPSKQGKWHNLPGKTRRDVNDTKNTAKVLAYAYIGDKPAQAKRRDIQHLRSTLSLG